MRKKSLIVATFLLIIDQIIKIVIDKTMMYGEIKTVISNFFYVTKVYNDGAAWSVLQGNVIFLVIIAIFSMIFLLKYEKYFENKYRNIMAFGLVYGGLCGNLLDRIMYGHVIDYFKILFGSYSFPVFNLADIAIVCGFILIIYSVIKGEDKYGVSSRKRK